MAITLATAQANLDRWIEADAKAAEGGRRFELETGRSLTGHSPAEIARQIAYWSRVVSRLEGRPIASRGRLG